MLRQKVNFYITPYNQNEQLFDYMFYGNQSRKDFGNNRENSLLGLSNFVLCDKWNKPIAAINKTYI